MSTMRKAMATLFWGIFLLCGISMVNADDNIYLIVRGDDLGMTQGSLDAFEQALNNGVLSSASVLAVGPWFEGAAELCRKNPGWCIGIHLALVGEWRGYRWRPCMPWDKVSSIVDEDGFLYGSPDELWAHKPDIREIEAELWAQVSLAQKKGVRIDYLDTHYMGKDDYPGLADIIRDIACELNVPFSGDMDLDRIGIYMTPPAEKKARIIEILNGLEPGTYLWVSHPGTDSPEQNALIHRQQDHIIPEGVGLHRAKVLAAQTDFGVRSAILRKGIILTNYTESWERMGRKYHLLNQ